jgi:hypothetical protein
MQKQLKADNLETLKPGKGSRSSHVTPKATGRGRVAAKGSTVKRRGRARAEEEDEEDEESGSEEDEDDDTETQDGDNSTNAGSPAGRSGRRGGRAGVGRGGRPQSLTGASTPASDMRRSSRRR